MKCSTELEKVAEHIGDFTAKGGTLLTGGGPQDLGGLFFQLTIITSVTQDMKVAKEETFDLFAPLFRFQNIDDVMAMANETIFGLASYFNADDLSRVTRVATNRGAYCPPDPLARTPLRVFQPGRSAIFFRTAPRIDLWCPSYPS